MGMRMTLRRYFARFFDWVFRVDWAHLPRDTFEDMLFAQERYYQQHRVIPGDRKPSEVQLIRMFESGKASAQQPDIFSAETHKQSAVYEPPQKQTDPVQRIGGVQKSMPRPTINLKGARQRAEQRMRRQIHPVNLVSPTGFYPDRFLQDSATDPKATRKMPGTQL